MIYANFDNNGELLGFYNPEINDNIPETTKEISEEVYNDFLNNQSIKRINSDTLQTEFIQLKQLTLLESKVKKIKEDWEALPLALKNQFAIHEKHVEELLLQGDKENALLYINDCITFLPEGLVKSLTPFIKSIHDSFNDN